MDIQGLLNGRECECGRTHRCEIKHVIIEDDAIARAGELADTYNHILLVADNNTYPICGDFVKDQIKDKCENVLIYKSEGLLVPNEAAIDTMQRLLTDNTDLIIGIGSGVIQDLCKYVSFYAKLPYHIIATAPSMDGYASAGAAMITGNMKVTYGAHVPEAIIADVNILKNAPMDMIRSGYGDILGKFSCLNDWKLSNVVNSEYLCDYVYDLTYDMLQKTKDLGKKLQERDPAAIKTLTEALIGVGVAMAYMGNSRPASGSEHHLSHFFEVTGIMNNEPYFMHGTDVAFSTVYTQRLREELIKVKSPEQRSRFNEKTWTTEIRRIYSAAAEGVIELQKKLGWYNKDYISIYKEKWDDIVNVLKDAPSSDMLIGYLESVGLDISDFENIYGKETIHYALWFAKDLKDRYSVLWLYYCLFYELENR